MERRAVERLVARWLEEGIVEGRLEVFDELATEDVCDASSPEPSRGTESFKRRAEAVRVAFGDIEARVDHLVIEGDAIAWRWSMTGTHRGTFGGVAPTGRRVALRGVNFQRLRDGRIAEHWTLADTFGLLAALR